MTPNWSPPKTQQFHFVLWYRVKAIQNTSTMRAFDGAYGCCNSFTFDSSLFMHIPHFLNSEFDFEEISAFFVRSFSPHPSWSCTGLGSCGLWRDWTAGTRFSVSSSAFLGFLPEGLMARMGFPTTKVKWVNIFFSNSKSWGMQKHSKTQKWSFLCTLHLHLLAAFEGDNFTPEFKRTVVPVRSVMDHK